MKNEISGNASEISIQNWENLIDLYKNISAGIKEVFRTDTPILSFYSYEYGWPNFSIISDINNDFSERFEIIDDNINLKRISPVFLTSPLLSENAQLFSLLEGYGIRQIDQWPIIFYDIKKGLPQSRTIPNFQVEIVSDANALETWHQIVKRVLFNGKNIPVKGFLNQEYMLLTGYLHGIPVATTLIFLGSAIPSVHMVAVLPEYRKQGLGQQIFMKAIELSAEMGYMKVFAQASQMGKKPWLEIGFEIDGYINVFWKVGCNIKE